MEVNFPPPKKKFKAYKEGKSSLPVPIASETGVAAAPAAWQYYQAVWEDGLVRVTSSSEAEAIYNSGYFGTGSLSSSGLSYAANCDIVNESRLERKEFWKNKSNEMSVESGDLNEQSEDDSDCGEELSRNVLVVDIDKESNSKLSARLEADPFPIEENLVLLKEEALFLSYALGCLVVSNNQNREMDIDMMWSAFIKADPRFCIRYVAYHHYRSKGWVVKSGAKFACDWVLYPVGPSFYHSQFMVHVRSVWADSLQVDESHGSSFTWLTVMAQERLSTAVGKNVLLLDVLRPRGVDSCSLENISCLKKFKIMTTTLSRWIPTSEMQNETKL